MWTGRPMKISSDLRQDRRPGNEVIDAGFDYTDVEVMLPHPFYSPMHCVCIVNPAEVTRSQLASLLERSHSLSKRQYDNRLGR